MVSRGELMYAVLNLHPYNPGHLMVVTYRHVGELEELTAAEVTEMSTMTRDAVVAVRAVSAARVQRRDQPRRRGRRITV